MKEFALTSEMFEGEVLFTFSPNGFLYSFDFSKSGVSEIQQKAILQRLPRSIQNLPELIPNSTGKITEIFQEITFGMFWERYFKNRYKDNSSKKKSEQRWNKMSKKERLAAYNHIGKYFNNIRQGTEPKLAETYLNAELWNN